MQFLILSIDIIQKAKEITIVDDSDVKAASVAAQTKGYQRIATEVIPELEAIGINHRITKSERGVRIRLGDYKLYIGARTGVVTHLPLVKK